MLSEGIILELQMEYGEIYTLELEGKDIAFRSLSIGERNAILRNSESTADAEDEFVIRSVIYPRSFDIDKMKAGHVTQLAEEIMKVHGLIDSEFMKSTLAAEREANGQDVVLAMKAYVLTAMSAYKEEELDQLTLKQLIQKVILAEQVLLMQKAVITLDSSQILFGIFDESEITEEQEAPRRQARLDKDALLRQIMEERGSVSPADTRDKQALVGFDEETIAQAAGMPLPDDPIARKLHQAMLQ